MGNGRRRAAIALAALALAGCTGQPAPTLTSVYDANDESTWGFEELIEKAIADAGTAQATDEQIATLVAAKAGGEVTKGQALDATNAYISCAEALGANVSTVTDATSLGRWWPSYQITGPASMSDQEFGLLDADCMTKNSAFVMDVYSNQPAAREALSEALLEHEAQLKQCLIAMGGGSEVDSMTLDELWSALKDQSFGGEDYGYSREKDCIIDAGINW